MQDLKEEKKLTKFAQKFHDRRLLSRVFSGWSRVARGQYIHTVIGGYESKITRVTNEIITQYESEITKVISCSLFFLIEFF